MRGRPWSLTLGAMLAGWALWNAAVVYLAFGGERQHRLETAMLLLVTGAGLAEVAARAKRANIPPTAGLAAPYRQGVTTAAVVTWLAVWTSVAGVPFLSDDYVLLARYADATTVSPQQFFRPVFGALFSALSWAGEEAIWPFRLAGMLLHVGSATLASRLTSRIADSPTAGTIGFVVFLLNPLQAEAVVWIAGLQETLWTFLALCALAVHAEEGWTPVLRLAAVTGLSALAFGAKETAACLLLLVPGLDISLRRRIGGRSLATYAAVGTAFAAYLAMRSRSVAFEAEILALPTRYFLKQFVTLPYQLYMQPWSAAAVAMPAIVSFGTAVVGIAGLAWTLIGQRRWRVPSTGAFVIVASTLPLAGYFFVRDDLAGARYLYFGAFGWALLVWAALASALPSARSLGAAIAAIGIGYGALLHVNLRPWRQAAEIVRQMETAARRGADPVEAANRSALTMGVQLVILDGLPREVGGVGLFVNGYSEFLTRNQRAPTPP